MSTDALAHAMTALEKVALPTDPMTTPTEGETR